MQPVVKSTKTRIVKSANCHSSFLFPSPFSPNIEPNYEKENGQKGLAFYHAMLEYFPFCTTWDMFYKKLKANKTVSLLSTSLKVSSNFGGP